jgi:hypothetical protein
LRGDEVPRSDGNGNNQDERENTGAAVHADSRIKPSAGRTGAILRNELNYFRT